MCFNLSEGHLFHKLQTRKAKVAIRVPGARGKGHFPLPRPKIAYINSFTRNLPSLGF